MAPVEAIVVPSTIVWMLKELWVQILLRRDQQDWIAMAHVSMMLKLFLLEWWQLCCLLPINVFHLFGGPFIHVNAMEESVHRYDSSICVV